MSELDDFDFGYEERSTEQILARTQQDSGQFDRYLDPKYQVFAPKGGNSYEGRIAMPTWVKPDGSKADHWGMEIWLNYGLGAEQGTYLSRSKHGHTDDPVLDLMSRMRQGGASKESLKELKAKKRVLVWWLDAHSINEGWKLWAMPWTVDRDIAKRCYHKTTGSVLLVDHPVKGYNISFDVSGSGQQTKYEAVDIARESTPIVRDREQLKKLVQFVKDNPLHETLKFYSAEYIGEILAGMDVESMSAERQEDVDDDTTEIPEPRDEPTAPSAPSGRESLGAEPPAADHDDMDLDAELDEAF